MRGFAALIMAFLALAPPLSLAGVKEDLQGVKKKLSEQNQLLNQTRQTETKVSGELEKIQRTLKEKEQNLAAVQRELASVEGGIGRTLGEIDRVEKDTEQKKAQINKRLAALYKAGDVGTLRILFSSESFPQMTENLRYMRGVLANDRKLFQQYNDDLARLRRLKEGLEKDASRKESVRRNVEARKREVEAEKTRKASYLVQVRRDKQSYISSIKELQVNAKRLQSMFERLEARNRKLQEERNRKLKEERARKAQEERNRKALEAKKGKGYSATARPSSRPPESGKGSPESAPREEVATPAPIPGKGLGGQKGRLTLPVKGTVTAQFGRHKHPEFNSFTVSNGISIAAGAGTPIRAVYDGEVIFADYFKGYGNMVIVDHGGGYFSLYAHASSIAKRVGAKVTKNEVVASVGDLDSAAGPMLYFEIRYQGKPIDPSPWFR